VFYEAWKTNLFMELAFIDLEFQGELLDQLLEKGNVLVVFFALDDDLHDVPLLLAQDPYLFGMVVTLLAQFQLDIAHSASSLLMMRLLLTNAFILSYSRRMVSSA
jgi:hypothetical protein